jgi:uncharacterized SAM-binding protein YcdF (DUF218 family)
VARRRSLGINLTLLALLIVVIALTHSTWMGWMGAFLVKGESPSRADLVVVLAGDRYGHRILKGAELVKEGYAPKVLVSGPAGFYGLHESDLAIPFAEKRGFPASWFIAFPHESHSTDEEARMIWPELRKRNMHRVLVVTSDYHTRRALHTLRARWPGIDVCMVAAPDEFFSAYGWWHTREGRKTFFLECTKTLASMVGM